MSKLCFFARTGMLQAEPLIARIDRYLNKLIPYRHILYDTTHRQYFVEVVSDGPENLTRHGPYYYCYMVGLARHLNALTPTERALPAITIRSRNGLTHQEKPLPRHLKFAVLTPALQDMITQLQAGGWTVHAPALTEGNMGLAPVPSPAAAPVTAQVTTAPIETGTGEAGTT